jgi:hypothetical protein
MKADSFTITLKRGRETRRFVVENDLGITVGAEVRLRGEIGEPPWTIRKIEPSEIIVRFIRATATPNPPPTSAANKKEKES